MPFLSFMHDLIAILSTSSPKLNRPIIQEETVHRLTGRHFPVSRSIQQGGGRRKTKKCCVCYARGIKTASGIAIEVNSVCRDCPSHPGLHVDQDCFLVYHTKIDYYCPPEALGDF